jgi:hypothetical protein
VHDHPPLLLGLPWQWDGQGTGYTDAEPGGRYLGQVALPQWCLSVLLAQDQYLVLSGFVPFCYFFMVSHSGLRGRRRTGFDLY